MPKRAPTKSVAAVGQRASREARQAKARTFYWGVRDGIIALAKAGELGRTLKEIATQLAARGVCTARGNPVDQFKLSAALRNIGLDANSVRRWLQASVRAADEFGVLEEDMRIQLWKEWLDFEQERWVNGLNRDTKGDVAQFMPRFVHPHLYMEPSLRGVHCAHHVAGSPPTMRLAYSMFRMFEINLKTESADTLVGP